MHESYKSTFTKKVAGVPCPTCKWAGAIGAVVTERIVDKRRCRCDGCGAPSQRLAEERRVDGVLVAAEEAPTDWTRVASRTGAEPEQHLCQACAQDLEHAAGVVTAEAHDLAITAREERRAAAEVAAQEREAEFAAAAANLLDHKQAMLEQGRIELHGFYTVQTLLQLVREHLAERGI